MNNLVPGGISGPGRFMTRRSRVVQIKRLVEHAKPLEPGQIKPVMVEVWEGELYRMDGISVDTLKYWDKSGACESMNGVASELDIVTVISVDPVPDSPAQPFPVELVPTEPSNVVEIRESIDESEAFKSFKGSDWAKAFVQHVRRNPAIPLDEGAMTAWFSHAIMRGYDQAIKDRGQDSPKPADERATEPESAPEANQEHNASAEV